MTAQQMLQLRNFLLVSVLPNILFPLLVALVAALGVNRWRRTLLWFSISGLILFIVSVLLLRPPVVSVGIRLFGSLIEFLYVIASPSVTTCFILGEIGGFMAIVLAARSRSWGWFTILLVTALITAVGGLFAFSPYALTIFGAANQARDTFYTPLYAIITGVPTGLSLLTQLLYAFFGPRDSAPSAAATEAAAG